MGKRDLRTGMWNVSSITIGPYSLLFSLAVDFVGFYENHKYDKGGKNGSHFVNIYKTWDGKSFTWRNAEGQQWKLHPNTGNKLRVDQNCPYYKSGYQYARFNSTGVEGPLNEFYKKEGRLCLIYYFE